MINPSLACGFAALVGVINQLNSRKRYPYKAQRRNMIILSIAAIDADLNALEEDDKSC